MNNAPRPFTSEEYHGLAEIGVLGTDDRVELMNGTIIDLFPPQDQSPGRRAQAGQPRPHRFTRCDYHRMTAAGVLMEDDRVELMEGRIVCMSPVGPRHNYVVDVLSELLRGAVQPRAVVRVQGSIGLGEFVEPQPDIVLLVPPAERYRDRLPAAEDVLLIVEVAESSREYDLQLKSALYAGGGIREYWVVDLVKRVVAVHRGPSADVYREITEHGRDATISPIEFPDIALPLARCFD